MADSKDTGTGGINLEGKVYTYDVGVPDNQGGAQGAWSPGDVTVDNAQKDLSKPTRITLAQYLSKVTLGKVSHYATPNDYPVGSGDATVVNEIKITDEHNLPSPLYATTNEASFADIGIGEPTPIAMKKGKEFARGPNGNQLLPNAAVPAQVGGTYVKNAISLNEPIASYTREVLNPNLNSPLDDKPIPDVVVGDGGNISPANVRDLRIARIDYGDRGTADGILSDVGANDVHRLTMEQLVNVPLVTTNHVNKYFVDGSAKPNYVTLVDGNKMPVSPSAAQANPSNSSHFANVLSSSYTDAFKIANSASPAFNIKRGKARGTDPDGNELLPGIAPESPQGIAQLTDSAATYTKSVLDPNLYSPLDDKPVPNVIVGDGGTRRPDNVRDLKYIPIGSDVTSTGGTSAPILGPDDPQGTYTLTLSEAVSKAHDETGYNRYPVDTAIAADKINLVSVTDNTKVPPQPFPLAESGNSSKFASVNIGASKSINSKGKQIELDGNNSPLPDGNTLLPSATIPAAAGGEYVKIAKGLNDPIKAFTTKQLDPNLYSPFDAKPVPDVVVGDGGNAHAENVRSLHIATTIAEDGGTSSHILSPDDAHTLTLAEMASKASQETKAPQGPGNLPNKFTVDPPVVQPGGTVELSSINDPATGYPMSPTAAQDNPKNSYQFSNYVPTSYSDSLSESNIQIKRGKAAGTAPDGNTLLSTATTKAPAGGSFIKKATKLNEPIKSYTQVVVQNNLYTPATFDQNDASVVDNAGTANEEFFGPEVLHRTSVSDLGTSDGLKLDPATRIGKVEILSKYNSTVDAGAGMTNPFRAVADPNAPLYKISNLGYPTSPTAEQAADVGTGPDIKYIPGSKLPSSYTDEATKLKIARGKSISKNDETPDGNSLLLNAAAPAPAGGPYVKDAAGLNAPIIDYVSAILQKNRFNPISPGLLESAVSPGKSIFGRRFWDLNDPFRALAADSSVTFSAPRSLTMGSSQGPEESRQYSLRRLAQIGHVLQLQAAGELPVLIDESVNPTQNAATAGSLLPGVGQLDLPRPVDVLNIENIIRNLTESPVNDFQLINPNSTFEGTINSFTERFASFSAVGMTALVITLVTVITLAYDGIGLLLGLNKDSPVGFAGSKNVVRKNGYGRPGVGAFNSATKISSPEDLISAFLPVGGDSSKLLTFLGIRPTMFSLALAIGSGTKSFFGLDDSFNPLKSVAVHSPGYYAIMARTIVRSVARLVFAFKELIDIFASGNVFAGIIQIFDILGTIKNSRFVAAINVFAQLGDKDIEQRVLALVGIDETINGLDAGKKISNLDAYYDDDKSVLKSRLSGKSITAGVTNTPSGDIIKLAWSVNRTPDLLLKSDATIKLAQSAPALGSGRLMTTDPLQLTRFEFAEDGSSNRISDEKREAYEKQFDSEYVPFYFHDLRTNEILGFHAFLMSLTDDYSANYESTDAFGRVDPVKTYKSTNRKISFSFLIAALDELDFDSMWMKINKLTTLVYPQYTEGQMFSNQSGDYQFEKPFTQSIGASPMIRLRLGNLFASNYSKFNLAGIFGLTNEKSIINTRPASELTKETVKEKRVLEKYRKGYVYTVNSLGASQKIFPAQVRPDGSVVLSTDPGDNLGFNPSTYSDVFLFQIDSTDEKTGHILGKFIENKNSDIYVQGIARYDMDVSANKACSKVTDKTFWLPFSFLNKMDESTQKKYDSTQLAYPVQVASFLQDVGPKENTNAIARSFRSAGGKGLAGFIDSINFDWYDRVTWDIDNNRKAPKMCKVSVSFTPIHDISPGLSANGYNRAPIYPIGPHSR